IFVAVDRAQALAEAREQAGDGSCKTTVLDPTVTLRPSIETTFHAALDHPVVVHTHSVAALVHLICAEGRTTLDAKLAGLPFARVPYAKPGLPLTREILARVTPQTTVILLQNHGIICCGPNADAVSDLVAEVEARLALPAVSPTGTDLGPAPDGFTWAPESWVARDGRAAGLATAGSYYPDHVVFLGPALPQVAAADADLPDAPAVLVSGRGILLRAGATGSQRAMLRCLADVLARLPADWQPEPIGPEAEASLLNWDAEKYRQALAARR
ncbi:MAG: class II aldolase/adducin family protein, partial [Pseudomonadota bacterium]